MPETARRPRVPTPADLARLAADYVQTHPITYDALVAGPLGEALTVEELRALADDRAAVAALVGAMRDMADAYERWATHHDVNVARMGRIGT